METVVFEIGEGGEVIVADVRAIPAECADCSADELMERIAEQLELEAFLTGPQSLERVPMVLDLMLRAARGMNVESKLVSPRFGGESACTHEWRAYACANVYSNMCVKSMKRGKSMCE